MDKSSFDAAASVQFNLENGIILSSVKEKQLTLLPIEILSTLEPGVELEKVAYQYGHLHGAQLLETLPKPDAGLGIDALADHLGGTTSVLGIGRLTRQKDFPTLIRAFAVVRRQRPLRLIILGEGRDRAALEQLAAREGVGADVALPGFQANPYAWLARARLFVLSSAWEGSPNALTEAMALGVQVVATDCRSGPRELLDAGRYGQLVPVGDAEALAGAMREALDHPLPPEILKSAVRDYAAETSARRYLEVLGL